MAYKAIQAGAKGVDMGRNVFQSEHPVAMIKAIRKVVHEGFTGKEAFEFFNDEIH
jgi:putative autoinducer-2 (AI-2) aldolase